MNDTVPFVSIAGSALAIVAAIISMVSLGRKGRQRADESARLERMRIRLERKRDAAKEREHEDHVAAI